MEDKELLDKVRQATNDNEKLELIGLIQDEKIKEKAVYLLENDLNKISAVESFEKDNYYFL